MHLSSLMFKMLEVFDIIVNLSILKLDIAVYVCIISDKRKEVYYATYTT